MHAKLKLAVILSIASVSSTSYAQAKPEHLLVKVDQVSSGPMGGEKTSLCLRIYDSGRIVDSEWSRAGVQVVDSNGNKTRSEKTETSEYQIPQGDRWQMQELADFTKSKSVAHLSSSFPPSHPPIDFVENSTIGIMLPNGKTKTITVREYYSASLVERAKYPSALVLLMERLAQIEDEVAQKGKRIEPPADCESLRK